MRHRQAIQHLPSWVEGTLDADTEALLGRHIGDCFACREWLATHAFLAAALGGEPDADLQHPATADLALCAIRPEEVHEPGREDLRRHLQLCLECRETTDTMAEAVEQARSRPVRESVRVIRSASKAPAAWMWGMAAGLAVCLVGAGIILASSMLPRGGFDSSDRIRASSSSPADPPVEEFLDHDLEGTQVIRAERGLRIARVLVRDGANVTFEARDGVALGDGFRVSSGARVRIGSGSGSWEGPGGGASEVVEKGPKAQM